MAAPLVPNTDNVYILEPYNQTYIRTDNKDLENSFISSKSIAIKEALVRMGAKHILLEDETQDQTKKKADGSVKAGNPIASGEASVDYEKRISVTIKCKIE